MSLPVFAINRSGSVSVIAVLVVGGRKRVHESRMQAARARLVKKPY